MGTSSWRVIELLKSKFKVAQLPQESKIKLLNQEQLSDLTEALHNFSPNLKDLDAWLQNN